MSTATHLYSSKPQSGNLRPFDVVRDLKKVADLVEQCFAETLDHDGQRYLQQMRSAARSPGYLRWAGLVAERAPLPLSGYVWVEDDRLIGNLTLIPYNSLGQRYYLIANVAVHPEYRRRGIANRLTATAIEHAQRRNAQAVWLHVREENQGAIDLYQAAGFIEQARRTTWHFDKSYQSGAGLSAEPTNLGFASQGVKIDARRGRDWDLQRRWLEQYYPSELTWHLSLKWGSLRPGILGFLQRMIMDIHIQQWSARGRDGLLGVLAWQATNTFADNLWLATNPEYEEEGALALLTFGVKHFYHRRPLALDYPAGYATNSIEKAGFHQHQTLIWMALSLN
jgi:ribosomal protein S18 acetylase RimI-like enzyme